MPPVITMVSPSEMPHPAAAAGLLSVKLAPPGKGGVAMSGAARTQRLVGTNCSYLYFKYFTNISQIFQYKAQIFQICKGQISKYQKETNIK